MTHESQTRPAPVRAVLFDYGLVLTGPADPQAWERMARIMGVSEEDLHRAYWAERHEYDRGTHTGESYWQAAGQILGLELEKQQVDELLAADIDLWTQPNDAMIAWAQRLRRAGTRVGILSNLGDSMMHGVLARLPWLAEFDHHTFSHTLKLIKPDRAIYAHAAVGLATQPDAILFVDDRAENVAGAEAFGMQAIRYTTQEAFEAEMQARGFGELWTRGLYAPDEAKSSGR